MSKYYFDKDSGLMYEKNQEGSFEPSKRFSEDLFESNQIYIDDDTKDVYAKENNKWIKAETERPGLGRSLKAGYHNLMSGFGGLKTGIGSATENSALQKSGEELIEKHQRLSNELMVGAQDWRDISSASDVFNFVGENFGASAPHMAFTLGATAIGGPVGGYLAGGSRAAAVAGSVAAGTAASTTLYTGSNVQRQVMEEDVDVDLKKAASYGVLQGMGDTLFNFTLLGKGFNFKPSETFLGKVGTRITEAVALGAPLEAVQQGFERMSASLEANPLESEDAANEYLDAFFAGMAGSLPPGAVSGVVEGVSASREKKEKKETPSSPLPQEEVAEGGNAVPVNRDELALSEAEMSPETPTRAETYQQTQMRNIQIPEETQQRIQQEVYTETNRQTAKDAKEYITRQLPEVSKGKQRLFTARPIDTDKNFIPVTDTEVDVPSKFNLKEIMYGQNLEEVTTKAQAAYKDGFEIDAVDVPRQTLNELSDGPVESTKRVPFTLHERSQTVYNSARDSSIESDVNVDTSMDGVPSVTKDGQPVAGRNQVVESPDTPIQAEKPRVRVRAKQDEEGNPIINQETGLPEYDITPVPPTPQTNVGTPTRLNNIVSGLNMAHKRALGKDTRAKRQLGTTIKKVAEDPNLNTKETVGATSVLLSSLRTPNKDFNTISDIESWYHLTETTETITVPREDITNSLKHLSKQMAKKHKLNQADVLYSESQLIAESFADFKENPMGNYGAMKKHFAKANKVILETKKTLNQNGIQFTNELYGGDLTQIYNNITDVQLKRLKAASKKYRRDLKKKQLAEAPKFNEITDGNFMSGLTKYIISANYLASRSSLFATLRDAVVEGRELRENYQHDFAARLSPLATLPENTLNRLMAIMVNNRKNNRRAVMDDEGFLRYLNEKGEQVVLRDRNLSQIYIDTQKVFRDIDIERMSKLLHKKNKDMYKRLGLRNAPSKLELQRVLEKYPDLNETKRAAIQQTVDSLTALEKRMDRDYVPLMRLGEHQRGITVHDKDGNLAGFYTYEIDKRGRPIHKDHRQEVIRRAKEMKKEVGVGARMSNEFELTANNIEKYIPSESMTLEILSGLINLGDSKVYSEAYERVMANSVLRGFKKHDKEAEFIDGYTTDWKRALSGYVDSAANHLANTQITEKRDKAFAAIERGNVGVNTREYARNYLQTMESPMEHHQWIRTFQYAWVLGFGFSSAMVQLASVPTTMAAVFSQANGSHIKSTAMLSKNISVVFKDFLSTKNSLEGTPSFLNILDHKKIDSMVSKGSWTKDKAQFMKEFNETGYSLPGFTTELVGLSPNDLKLLTNKLNETLKKYGRLSGIFMSTTETAMRVATALTLYDMQQNNPQGIQKLHETYLNDGRYRALQRRTNPDNMNEPNLMNLVKVMIEESLGAYGKAERAPYQNNLLGAIALPFSTYIHRATELFVELTTRRGMAGKKEAAALLGAFLSMAGVWGLPGMEVLRFVFENVMTQITGEETDADELLRRGVNMIAPGETGPMLAQMASKGVASGVVGADLSKRIGLNIPGEDIVSSINKGGVPIERLGGVPGGIIADVFTAGQRLLNGEDYARVLPELTPKFIKDPYQANVQWMRQGIQSSGASPAQLKAPEDISTKSRLLKSFGFNPLPEQEIKTYDFKVRASSRKNLPGRNRIRDRLIDAIVKEQRGIKEGDLELIREGRKEKSRLIQELGKFLKETDTPNLGSSLKRTIASARDSALVKVYPERRQLKLTKPQRIQYSDKKLKDLYKVE